MSAREAWERCERGDWMLWVYGRLADSPGWPAKGQVSALLRELATDTTMHFVQAFDRLPCGAFTAYLAAAVLDGKYPVNPERPRLLREAAAFIRQRLGGPFDAA